MLKMRLVLVWSLVLVFAVVGGAQAEPVSMIGWGPNNYCDTALKDVENSPDCKNAVEYDRYDLICRGKLAVPIHLNPSLNQKQDWYCQRYAQMGWPGQGGKYTEARQRCDNLYHDVLTYCYIYAW